MKAINILLRAGEGSKRNREPTEFIDLQTDAGKRVHNFGRLVEVDYDNGFYALRITPEDFIDESTD